MKVTEAEFKRLLANSIEMDWEMETKDPVAEVDAIAVQYGKTMGLNPVEKPNDYQFMKKQMAKVELMLVGWWGWHRDLIRQALVAYMQRDDVNEQGLKPCHFCGNKHPKLEERDVLTGYDYVSAYIRCGKCEINPFAAGNSYYAYWDTVDGHYKRVIHKEIAVAQTEALARVKKIWNTRAPDEERTNQVQGHTGNAGVGTSHTARTGTNSKGPG